MTTNKWDTYFVSHYRPMDIRWSKSDVGKYKKWYYAWINFIEKRCTRMQKKARIFEIGSAMGAVAEILHDRGHSITGSDISNLMVKIANQLCFPIPFVLCDVQKVIPIQTKADIIVGFEVLEHVPNLKLAMNNIRNALNSDGYFIGTSPYPYRKNYLDRTHVNVKYPDEWKKLFLENGFSDIQLSPMSFLPLIWRLSKYLNPVIPFYISWPFFVSTTLIIAKK